MTGKKSTDLWGREEWNDERNWKFEIGEVQLNRLCRLIRLKRLLKLISLFFVVTPSCQKVEYYCSSPAEIEPDQYLFVTLTELGEILSTLYLLNCDGDV